jgi:hypothetical protein|tara:strand:+ start:75 stop:548 length:474 start_codon:yes stop_codon:yes gene_type:complete
MSNPKKIIFTPPFDPAPEIQTAEDGQNYYAKVVQLNHQDLCIELSNVMAAKHNIKAAQSDLENYIQNQTITTDLTDRATIICFSHFGQSRIMEYCGEEHLRQFNALVNDVDEEVAQLDIDGQLNMQPDQHGNNMLEILDERLNHPIKKTQPFSFNFP